MKLAVESGNVFMCQVASAISLAVSKLIKFSVEAGMKRYAPGKMIHELFVKKVPPYFSESVTETNRSEKNVI